EAEAQTFRHDERVTKVTDDDAAAQEQFRHDEAVTKDAAAQAEIAALKARIAELEAEVSSLRAFMPLRIPKTVAEMDAMRAQATANRKAKLAEGKAKREAAKAAKLAQATAERPTLDVPTLLAENLDLRDQLKARNSRIRNLSRKVGVL